MNTAQKTTAPAPSLSGVLMPRPNGRTLVKAVTFTLMLFPMLVGAVAGVIHVGFAGGYDAAVDALDELFD